MPESKDETTIKTEMKEQVELEQKFLKIMNSKERRDVLLYTSNKEFV